MYSLFFITDTKIEYHLKYGDIEILLQKKRDSVKQEKIYLGIAY